MLQAELDRVIKHVRSAEAIDSADNNMATADTHVADTHVAGHNKRTQSQDSLFNESSASKDASGSAAQEQHPEQSMFL